jgi:uncharacterized membrane protein YuzA (DUF378 family)
MNEFVHTGLFWGIVGLAIIITFALLFARYEERQDAASKS